MVHGTNFMAHLVVEMDPQVIEVAISSIVAQP